MKLFLAGCMSGGAQNIVRKSYENIFSSGGADADVCERRKCEIISSEGGGKHN